MDATTVRSPAELVDTLRERRDETGVTNACVEEQLLLNDGGAAKIFSAKGARSLSLFEMFDLIDLLGCRLTLDVDPELTAKQRSRRWELRRFPVGTPTLTTKLLAMARPLVLAQSGKHANTVRNAVLTPEQRQEIARAAALAKHRRRRAVIKEQVRAREAREAAERRIRAEAQERNRAAGRARAEARAARLAAEGVPA